MELKIRMAGEQPKSDLLDIGRLIRAAYRIDPCWNSWSFALFDIWAFRRMGETAVLGQAGWQQEMRLVEDGDGKLLGAVVFRDPDLVKVVTLPGCNFLYDTLLHWAEIRASERNPTPEKIMVEAVSGNVAFEKVLSARGYEKGAGHYIFREKELEPGVMESVLMPEGFHIKHIETVDDLRKFHHGTAIVFNFPDNPGVYQVLRQATSFRPELDLIILSPSGEIAAIASAWFDPELRLAEFEPVGTLPVFRRLGLGRALLAEACNRLISLGCETASVMSWSESEPANRLYETAGFKPIRKKTYWVKRIPLKSLA